MPEAMPTQEDLQNMSPEEIAELQRKNCIFCKIVREEIPAKKVYEDDQILAILDINPASKGHTLVLPKEHYPLLPLLPLNLFNHLFAQTQKLIQAIEKATLSTGVTVFIANGAAAGQQSPHFLFHLIPRENATDIPIFSLPSQGWPDQQKVQANLQKQLLLLLKPYLARTGKLKPIPTYTPPKLPQATPQTTAQAVQPIMQPIPLTEPIIQEVEAQPHTGDPFDPARLPELLETNQELRKLIIQQPDQLVQFIKNSPELAKLFHGINVHRLSQKLAEYEQVQRSHGEAAPPKPNTDKKPAEKADLDKVSQLFQ